LTVPARSSASRSQPPSPDEPQLATITLTVTADFACARCGASGKVHLERSATGRGPNHTAAEADARALAERIASSDVGILTCPRCRRRPRERHRRHWLLLTALATPVTSAALVSLTVGRLGLGGVGALLAVTLVALGVLLPRWADRGVRFELADAPGPSPGERLSSA
jgi:hypothetical protein